MDTLVGHLDCITSVAFTPDGNFLASGSWDSTVRLWSVNKCTILHVFTKHVGRVLCVCFTIDGKYLASSGQDTVIQMNSISDMILNFVPNPRERAMRAQKRFIFRIVFFFEKKNLEKRQKNTIF